MLGNLVSGLAGRSLAARLGGVASGPVGMAIGLLLPFVARRLGPWGMVSMAVGSWAVARVQKQRAAATTLPPA